MTALKLPVLTVSFPLSESNLAKLREKFQKVHFYPDSLAPKDALEETDVWFSTWSGPTKDLKGEDVPNLKLLQLTSAGANSALKSPFLSDKKIFKQIQVSTASGIHVYSIPQYLVAQVINLYANLHTQIYLTRKGDKWPDRKDLVWGPDAPTEPSESTPLAFESLRGKTVGLLGYGHIGREAARLFKAFGTEIIAANSSGSKKADEGYVIPGTGDLKGDLPSAWYSTTDPKSFAEFFKKTDILIASLPSTPATTYLLKKEHLDLLPKGAVFVNVGRGDLVRSEDIISALDSSRERGNGLFAAALDVTDPEPLPDHHPLFSHPRVIITPHTSGNFAGYMDAATDLLIANVENVRKGGKAYNAVDPEKGY